MSTQLLLLLDGQVSDLRSVICCIQGLRSNPLDGEDERSIEREGFIKEGGTSLTMLRRAYRLYGNEHSVT